MLSGRAIIKQSDGFYNMKRPTAMPNSEAPVSATGAPAAALPVGEATLPEPDLVEVCGTVLLTVAWVVKVFCAEMEAEFMLYELPRMVVEATTSVLTIGATVIDDVAADETLEEL